MSTKKIFISHAHQDSFFAESLARLLKAEQMDVWMDEDLKLGEEWDKSIKKALGEASIVIVILSENWEESKFAAFELGMAYGKNKKIVPVLISGSHKNIPFNLKSIHVLDATKLTSEELAEEIGKAI